MFEIANYYEQLVRDRLWKKMEGRQEVPDTDFLADVACVALNALPARYVRSTVDLGSHLGEGEFLAMQQRVDAALEDAIHHVESSPRDSRERP